MLGLSGRSRERRLAEALAASLDAVRAGTASVDDCLRRYPAFAAELEPLLRTAARLQVLSRIAPSEEARFAGRAAFLQAAAQRRQPATITPRPVVHRRPWIAFAPAAVAAALFAAIAIPVVGSMDTGSTPGDWNYGFKRATERIRLAITTDPGQRRLLRLEFAARRLDEIERLNATGHVASQRSDVIAVIHDYQADIAQVTASTQSAGALPAAQKDQFVNVTVKATDVLSQVQQSVPPSDPVNSAAQNAKDETGAAATVAQAVPTTTPRSAGNPPSPTRSPATAAVTATQNATPATVVTTPPPTASAATPPPGTGTPASTGTPSGTGTPAATGTASGTSTVVSGSATAAPTPVPTREAPVLAPILLTPANTAVSPAASTPSSTPVRTPSPPPASSTPASAPPASGTPEPAVVAANPARTPLPAALAPAGGSPPPTTAAEPTPARTSTSSVPTPVGTRASTVLPPVTGSTTLGAGANVFKYAGEAASLDQITASLGGQLVVVWYVNAQQTSSSWYPGTPAPTIGPGTLLTIVTRGPAVLAAPGTLLSAGR
ncbi:MAG TPA: DUF5667 domain-containing protein [Dehalococcoidia bacterium]|nr:DUF5667 domain-containing protein [Dehalococcoidia bacterium]